MGWKRNPWAHLYPWIISLRREGYNLERILHAFEVNPSIQMDPNNIDSVNLATLLIKDALGELPPDEIDKHIFPSEVLSFSPAFEVAEGYVFNAHTPDGEDDFLFLVEPFAFIDVKSIDDVMQRLCKARNSVNQLVLFKYHTQSPYGLSGKEELANAKIFFEDTKKLV